MTEQTKELITAKAREFATAYTNRHFPNEPAFAFGNEGWAAFVDALVALSHPKSNLADSDVIAAPVAGAHPDKGTSALAVPVVPATWASAHWLQELERLAEKMMRDSWATGNDAAWKPGMAALLAHAATSPQAAPVAQLSDPPEADMFWNNDDPERCADSIHEVLEREWQDGILQVGDIRTIQQAMKLPNVRVIVTSADGDEDGFDYDLIEPTTTQKDAS